MGVRPTYEETIKPYLSKIINWRREGAKLDWIAGQFPIARGTFYEWKKRYPDLNDALKNSVEQFYDDLVVTAEDSLLSKLIDRFVVVEITKDTWIDGNGKMNEHIIEKKKLIQADTTAIIFALKNRKPRMWNNSEHELIAARIEKLKVEIERLGKGEDVGSLIMQSLNKYIGDGSE